MKTLFQNPKFQKGLFIMLSVILAAMQTPPVIWAVTLTSAVLIGAGYYIKNFWHFSLSDSGKFNFRDFIGLALISIITALGNSIAQYVIGEHFNLQLFLITLRNVAIAYFSSTLLMGEEQQKI